MNFVREDYLNLLAVLKNADIKGLESARILIALEDKIKAGVASFEATIKADVAKVESTVEEAAKAVESVL